MRMKNAVGGFKPSADVHVLSLHRGDRVVRLTEHEPVAMFADFANDAKRAAELFGHMR